MSAGSIMLKQLQSVCTMAHEHMFHSAVVPFLRCMNFARRAQANIPSIVQNIYHPNVTFELTVILNTVCLAQYFLLPK